MNGLNENKTMFYSTFSNEIKTMLQEGNRVSAFIEINKKKFPQGLIQKSAGTPNCKVIFNDESIDVLKLGDNNGFMMKTKEEKMFHLPAIEVESIELDIKKLMNTYGGSYLLYLDIKCKGSSTLLKFATDSLKPIPLIWKSTVLSKVEKKLNKRFYPLTTVSDIACIQEKMEQLSIDVPLVTE
ncbi:hypothetical protein [Enterococcus sp. DIV0876]|uniref:hypothetical protein n=1 Tax=Enterococcus sp. DIV0876 TaxID=2774633 RepID=UPI003D2FE257